MTLGSLKSDLARIILSLLLVSGVVIGAYMAWHHENQLYGDAAATLANCKESETINCEQVNTSPWSELFGVPIAAYAIPTYLLVLILLWGGRRRPSQLAYAFSIGLLTAIYSLFLFYVSKTQVGFLCLWCLRLYAINISIPVLTAFAARSSPLPLIRVTLADLWRWPGALRFTAAAFFALLALTVIAQQGYRAEIKARRADEIRRIMSEGGPTESAVPEVGDESPSKGKAPRVQPTPSRSDGSDDRREPRAPSSNRGAAHSSNRPRSSGAGAWRSSANRRQPVEQEDSLSSPYEARTLLYALYAGFAPLPGLTGSAQERIAAWSVRKVLSTSGPWLAGGLLSPREPSGPTSGASGPTSGSSGSTSGASGSTSGAPAEGKSSPSPQGTGPYVLAGPLRKLRWVRDQLKLSSEPYDLQPRLGQGRPVALIFWAPGWQRSEVALRDWTAWLKQNTPRYEVYAVSGRTLDQRDEEIWEAFSMMDLPADVPLLVDDGYTLSDGLGVSDIPNLSLFDAKGRLVIARIKSRAQKLALPPRNPSAEEIARKVAEGDDVPTVKRTFVYYPASELYGLCAPSFTLDKFNTTESFTFSGRSSSGRATLLMFWSSTCKHCQIEIPNLVAWVKAHPNKVDIVSITHIKPDKPGEPSHRKVTEAYIRSRSINWTVLEDPDKAVEDLYRSISTPTSFFIAPDGTVVDAWFYPHPEGFDEAITKELARVASGQGCKPVETPVTPRMSFTVMGPDGRRVDLASLLDKPSIVHFWATWCKPCTEELPSLVRFRDKLEKSGQGHVVLVSVEDESAGPQILKFAKSHGLDLRSYRAPKGGLSDKMDLSYRVPRSYLVQRGGVVVGSRLGGQNWDDERLDKRVLSRLKNSVAGKG